MAGRDAWQEGREIWERMRSWLVESPPATRGAPAALAALRDVGALRRLLDEAELAAVRAARRGGSSWSEIATRLGVTRQSAWERWRDLDDDPTPRAASSQLESATTPAVQAAAEHLIEATTRRRRANVTVPNVVGLPLEEALRVLQERKLLAIGPDPDGPPLSAVVGFASVVSDQAPEPGSKVVERSWVRLWLRGGPGGGPGGVREPRNPPSGPKALRASRDPAE